jgi:membrane protease YdiL (CAAX protease family)
VTFVAEEIAFRGALTARHNHGDGRSWKSGLFVSALWGLWHLPTSTGMSAPFLVFELLAVHCLTGLAHVDRVASLQQPGRSRVRPLRHRRSP